MFMEEFSMEDEELEHLQELTKKKTVSEESIKEVLNRKKLDPFELDDVFLD